MSKYLFAYCVYDPNNYFGHRLKTFEANSLEEAEKMGWEWLEGLAGKGKWEYVITPYSEQSSYRIYSNKEHRRL